MGSKDKALDLSYTALVLLILFIGLFVASLKIESSWNFSVIWDYKEKFLAGWMVTVLISLGALLLSSLIGTAGAWGLKAHSGFVRALARVYIELIRGTPFLVQILIFFYIVAHAVGVENRYFVGLVCLSVFSGAYLSEIFRAGVDSVRQSQMDAARALGLSPFQAFRFVVFPQTFRLVLGPVTGQFASLIKDSSLLSVIAISEFTLNAQEVNSFTYSTFEAYLPLAFGYLILTLPLSFLSRFLEGRFKYES